MRVSKDQPMLRVFLRALTRSVWVSLVFLGTLLTILLVPRQWYWLLPMGIATLFVVAAFRAVKTVRDEYESETTRLRDENLKEIADLQAMIAERDREIAKLKVRPYDEVKQRTVQAKLKTMASTERDLLRFLLQRGETEGTLIDTASQVFQREWIQAVERLIRDGLVLMREDLSQAPAYRPRLYRINPVSEAVLQDLLYPRSEEEATPRFMV